MSELQAVYEAVMTAEREGKLAALATVIRTSGSVPREAGSKMLVWQDGSIVGTIGGGAMESLVVSEARKVMQSGQSQILTYTLNNLDDGDPGICGGTAEIFVEAIGYAPTIVVIGCGHVGKALAEVAKWSGFRVLVSDDRVDLCTPENIPGMDGYFPVAPAELAASIDITPRTYVAAVTRGLPVDIQLFPPLLEKDVPYVGLIGSKRRWELTRAALLEYGLSDEQVNRIHSPIGLDIHAETPREIAVSIMAEIIDVYRGGD
jgi:xanthine dehydrogenase accessory factor